MADQGRKPRVFVGSSSEGLKYARGVQGNLGDVAEVTVWDQDVFQLSLTTIEGLINQLEQTDFAVFVFSPDDVATMRSQSVAVARDNVILELGLFIGKLTRERTFFLIPRDLKLHLPSDLLGVTSGSYEHDRQDKNWRAGTAVPCDKIRTALESFTRTGGRTQAEILDDIVMQLRTLMAKQLRTEYVGVFPDFIEKHICECLETAKTEIHIACDAFAYGAFSAPSAYDRYMSILETKRGRGVAVRVMTLNAERQKAQDRLQFYDYVTDERFKALRETNHAFNERVNSLGTKARTPITTVAEFFDALAKREGAEVDKHKGLITHSEIDQVLPIHLWLADGAQAVFSIQTFTEAAQEHGFASTDPNLISCLRSVWRRYADTIRG